MRITTEYGERLSTDNVKTGGLARLLAKYPSHGFVIDKTEAKELFERVLDPTPEMAEFVQNISFLDRYLFYDDDAVGTYGSTEPATEPQAPAAEPGVSGTAGSQDPGPEQPEVRQDQAGPGESGAPAAVVSISRRQ